MKESDREKFVRLAEKRVNRALKDIKLIGNLSNRSNYKYDDDDVKIIFRTLKNALEEMKKRFDTQEGENKNQFKLKG
ncbi:MAG: hypothetical protein OEY96_09615 [Gammaproteobacteria bacterium]|nr:hypothetical protein [Gammaproteobacteria bacterium]